MSEFYVEILVNDPDVQLCGYFNAAVCPDLPRAIEYGRKAVAAGYKTEVKHKENGKWITDWRP